MLSDEQISSLTNGFVKMGRKVGLKNGYGRQIALYRHEDCWDIALVDKKSKKEDVEVCRFTYPDRLPDDELDATIELAGYVSYKLHDCCRTMSAAKGSKMFQSKLTPEERSARAKKAVQARIAKYGQKTRSADRGDASGH